MLVFKWFEILAKGSETPTRFKIYANKVGGELAPKLIKPNLSQKPKACQKPTGFG